MLETVGGVMSIPRRSAPKNWLQMDPLKGVPEPSVLPATTEYVPSAENVIGPVKVAGADPLTVYVV